MVISLDNCVTLDIGTLIDQRQSLENGKPSQAFAAQIQSSQLSFGFVHDGPSQRRSNGYHNFNLSQFAKLMQTLRDHNNLPGVDSHPKCAITANVLDEPRLYSVRAEGDQFTASRFE